MAKIFAKRAYDVTKYDFHKLGSNTELVGHEDTPYKVNKVTYQDRIEAVSKNGGAVVFAAPDFEANNGTFSALFHASSSKAKDVWAGIQGIKLGIDELDAAWNTPDTSDDQALLRVILSKADTFDLSNGADRANGYDGKDKMNGRGGNDRLWGGEGNDHLRGGSGNDRLLGEAGADRIEAGTGKDVLNGGGGGDLLIGGTDGGRDTFVFTDWLDSMWGGDRDEIRNFSRKADKIDLRAMDADENTEAQDDLHWSGRKADDHAVWWKSAKGGVLVEADVSGDGLAEVQIFVRGVASLSESDLLL